MYKIVRVGDPFTCSTHLREVVYCDVIKRKMMLFLTLSGDIRQNETFKEKSDMFACNFTKQWIKIHFSFPPGGGSRARSRRIATRAPSLIDSFIFVHSHKQIILSVYEDRNVH